MQFVFAVVCSQVAKIRILIKMFVNDLIVCDFL